MTEVARQLRKNGIVHIVEGAHAGHQGSFVKYNGGAHNDQCMIRIEVQGVIRTVYVRELYVRDGRAPVVRPPIVPPPPVVVPPADNDAAWCAALMARAVPEARISQPDDGGYVYVFFNPATPEQLKVGRARQVEKRLRTAQVYVPQMRCVASFWCVDYVRGERLAHGFLEAHRVRAYGGPGNEWFQVTLLRASMACARAAQLA